MAYGYRESEHRNIPKFVDGNFETKGKIIPVDDTVGIVRITQPTEKSRPVVQASLGMHVEGLAQPHADPSDPNTAIAGSLYRFGREVDQTNFPRRKFRRFVKRWCKKNLVPLDADSDTSFETWVVNTPYTLARKNELRMKYERLCDEHGKKLTAEHYAVKSFIKDECYPDFKHARAINSRTDEYKITVGPILQLISNKVFSLKWFIKKIPIKDRPNYIMNRVQREGKTIFTSDYTSFEAHFKKELKDDCEFVLYQYMTQFLPEAAIFMHNIRFTGLLNTITFKSFKMFIEAKKMSGEMDTSLSNGFTNLMFMLFFCGESGCTNICGCIEGDDGIFVFDGVPPTEEEFFKYGLIIKVIVFAELNHASFCGMVFDMDDLTNVTDPISELVSFGWTTARYAKSKKSVHMCLLRAKALSLAYQYPACPILTKLAYKVCQLTASYDSRRFLQNQATHAFNQYELQMMLEAHQYFDKNNLNREPGIKTRILVQDLYGLTITEQLVLEKYIDDMTEIKPMCHPLIYQHAPSVWEEYYSRFTVSLPIECNFDQRVDCWASVRPKADFSHLRGIKRPTRCIRNLKDHDLVRPNTISCLTRT